MRVVHEHPKGLATVHGFEPAGHGGHLAEGRLDFHHIHFEGDAGADRGQGVVDVVPADERQAQGELSLRRLDHEARAVRAEFNSSGAQPGGLP